MSHLPVNHRLLSLYRVLGAACGSYLLAAGVVGIIHTSGGPPGVVASGLGLRVNVASASCAVALGAVFVIAAVAGRAVARWTNLVGGIGLLVVGLAMLSLMQTPLNVLAFTMTTCIVVLIIGIVLLAAGLYGRTGPRRQVQEEERYRHGNAADPEIHPWQQDATTTG